MSSPLTTSVTVTYNGRSTIDGTLGALEPCHATGELEMWVVDNASPDATDAHVRKRYPWVHVLQSGSNLGFAGGCNLGFSKVNSKYVLFLNPDAVLEPEGLRRMVEFMEEHPRCAIAGPAMIHPGGELQAAGVLHTPLSVLKVAAGMSATAFPKRREIAPGSPPFRTNWVGGACMLIRSSVYREVDQMDPTFFLYFEETDLCRKITDQGHEIWALGEVVISHKGGASTRATGKKMHDSGCIAEYYFASRYYYMEKNFGRARAVASELGELALLGARTAIDRLRRLDRNLLAHRLAGPVMQVPKPR